eukprot:CAMPEP_0170541500 /NCGR_PEP_ID=MMETSP0211-20121228/1220_1 /TAXON_ID=311385 /ORGANISM="Pseudokeronopsis sp., Strain OXSARD2" /LENGTH=172 /DNA_ID=CAMNT_0010844255 /DNA_START=310 /DNA_END=824 /DNA_ORIENTATION=+
MDVVVVTTLLRFSFFGTTWRIIIGLSFFYLVRNLTQNIFTLKYPEGYLWGFPGFYSLTVPYSETSDFFYSGHVGCCCMCFLESRACGSQKFSAFCLAGMLCQTFLMITLQSHYTIDILAGIIFAHYIWMLSDYYSVYVDWLVFGIPEDKRNPYWKQRGKAYKFALQRDQRLL